MSIGNNYCPHFKFLPTVTKFIHKKAKIKYDTLDFYYQMRYNINNILKTEKFRHEIHK